jgi:hypothetical protein
MPTTDRATSLSSLGLPVWTLLQKPNAILHLGKWHFLMADVLSKAFKLAKTSYEHIPSDVE